MPRAPRRIDPTELNEEPEVADDDDDVEKDFEAPPATRRRRTPAKPAPAPEPRRRRTRAETEPDVEQDDDADDTVIPISRGRKEIKRDRPAGDESFFRWDEEPQVVKFLDNEPWGYNQHWVTREGKKSFPCIGRRCPLCEIGVKASQKVVYTVVNLTKDGTTQTLEVGVQLEDTLAAYDADKKTGPLDRLYWALSRTEGARRGGRSNYNYVFTPIKDRDLEEDYGIDLDEAETIVDEAEIPSAKQVLGSWNESSLQEIADEILDH